MVEDVVVCVVDVSLVRATHEGKSGSGTLSGASHIFGRQFSWIPGDEAGGQSAEVKTAGREVADKAMSGVRSPVVGPLRD